MVLTPRQFKQKVYRKVTTIQNEHVEGFKRYFNLFAELITENNIIPMHLSRPLDILTNCEETFQKGEAFNRWLSTENENAKNIKLPPGLEQMSWWPDIICKTYPYINLPSVNTQFNYTVRAACSMCSKQKLNKINPKIIP
ncbi:unnamed protein product [Thelazia callipaeda]|uniref:Uncharacterized protein n=1 Tax=Thelazia callipaeda TaxID=103827 RepID=A0A0N5CMF8_THECL|nr:unnamed protein product [Thelazia callipaeda]